MLLPLFFLHAVLGLSEVKFGQIEGVHDFMQELLKQKTT